MIKFVYGDILETDAEALVNPVNCVGVMGKGLALQMKKRYPGMFELYRDRCLGDGLEPGHLFTWRQSNVLRCPRRVIINFATKNSWREPSHYHWIQDGLDRLITVIKHYQIASIAIPPLGCGNGGLEWFRVKRMMEQYLSPIKGVEIFIHEPGSSARTQ